MRKVETVHRLDSEMSWMREVGGIKVEGVKATLNQRIKDREDRNEID